MATCHLGLLRHLPVTLWQRVVILNSRQFSMLKLHRNSTFLLLQRTGNTIEQGECPQQQQNRGSLKLSLPTSTSAVNLSHRNFCSWMSTSTGIQCKLLQSGSDRICAKPRCINATPEMRVRLHGTTSKCAELLHVSVPFTSGNFNRAFSNTSKNQQIGLQRLQLLKPPLNLASVCASRDFSLFGLPERSAWARAIAEAEKIVGYPTSFIGLRCLLSDELSNVAMQVRKLVGTKHPLVKTARNFVYDGKYNIQTRGLIVLLISKAAGPSPRNTNKQTMIRGIYPSQRTLAEIAEMIHTAFLVHKGVVNIRDLLPSDGPRSIMEFGNKISVLSGDFLLASACLGLAQLRNTFVVDLISQSISDLTEAAFMALSEENGGKGQFQSLLNLGVADWAKYVYLSSGSLIAKSCRAALELAGHEEEMQMCAFEFGKNIALAQQLHQELLPFTSSDGSPPSFSLTSAPVLLHIEGNRDQERVRYLTKLDIRKLHREIRSGSAIKKSQELCRTYGESARMAISSFPQSDARTALENMVNAVTL